MSTEAEGPHESSEDLVSVNVAIPTHPSKPQLDYSSALQAANKEGRHLGELFLEMLRLAWGPARLKPEEYFGLAVYASHLSSEERNAFLGRAAQDRLLKPHVKSLGAGLAHDKLRCELLLKGAGLPVPHTKAVVSAGAPPGAVAIRTQPQLVAFLSEPNNYPLFAKPMHGIRSGGAALLRGLDKQKKSVQVGAHHVSMVDLAEFFLDGKDSYLFQDTLRPSRETRDWAGDRLLSARLVLTVDDHGEQVFHAAILKLAAGDHDVDNFWRPGNIAAAVNLETGQIQRAVSLQGGLPTEVTEHPDTGAILSDAVLPYWSDVKRLTSAAAPLFAGLQIQAWDVALAEKGPVLLEVNIGGDFSLPQIALGRGIATQEFMQIVQRKR